jgi:hypothetical protein
MDVVTGCRKCLVNFNKQTLQLDFCMLIIYLRLLRLDHQLVSVFAALTAQVRKAAAGSISQPPLRSKLAQCARDNNPICTHCPLEIRVMSCGEQFSQRSASSIAYSFSDVLAPTTR